ncbi:hypothetical protein PISMIDRAFT_106928, partial [Pisolithus microcarpus 441]
FRPVSPQECYNLCDAELHNIVKRIIGVIKWCFQILVVPPEYGMDIQVCIPPVLCCVHNIIRRWDPLELEDFECLAAISIDEEGSVSSITDGITTSAECNEMSMWWDQIAGSIWASYITE